MTLSINMQPMMAAEHYWFLFSTTSWLWFYAISVVRLKKCDDRMLPLLYYLNKPGLIWFMCTELEAVWNMKFLVGSHSILLNHRTKRNCSNHVVHPSANAETQNTREACLKLLVAGLGQNVPSSLYSITYYFLGWIDTFKPMIPNYGLPVLLFKVCFLPYFHPKGKLHKFTLLPQQPFHDYVKCKFHSTEDLWMLMVKLSYKSYELVFLRC